jgi:hypothetical protein
MDPSRLTARIITADAAGKIALAHEVSGSSVNGSVLSHVVNLGTNNSCVCWIISLHPGSPLFGSNSSDTRAANFDFEVINARTGVVYSHLFGVDPSLPAYS